MLDLPGILAINRRAIELMRLNILHKAEDLLDQGIQVLGVNYDDNEETRGCSQGHSLPQDDGSRNAVRLVSVSVVLSTSTFVVGSKQDFSFAMYAKAFEILPTRTTTSFSKSDIPLLLCVFHYNIGLCYRLSSLASGTMMVSGDGLEQSLFAYEVAYDYLKESSQDAASPHRVLELALLNNMGHTCCLLQDDDEAQFRLGQVKVLLDEFLQVQKDKHGCSEDFTLFCNNVNYNESMLAGIPPPAA